jgi:hypothetical protein
LQSVRLNAGETAFEFGAGGGGGGVWGTITGTLANQTDLQAALDAKQAAGAEVNDGNSGATKTIDFSSGVPFHKVKPTANCTYTLINPPYATWVQIRFMPPDSDGFTRTFSPVPTWNGGVEPPTLNAGEEQVVAFYWDGSEYVQGDFTASANYQSTVTVSDAASDPTTWIMLARTQTGDQSAASSSGATFDASTGKATFTKIGGTISNGQTASTLLGRRGGSPGDTEEVALGGFSEMTAGAAVKPRGPLTNTTANGVTTVALATSNRHVLTLTANATLSLTGDSDGDSFVIWVRGQASGYTLGWWSGIKWVQGSPPTIPTIAGRVMAIGFTRLASGEYWASAAPEAY